MPIPINIQDLLSNRAVEWERVEFKAGWNPVAILHTICAFANDFNNWGGGYIVVGVGEQDGRPVLPPQGVSPEEIDRVQKELVNLCNRIRLPYFPQAQSVDCRGKQVLLIWAPAGPARPYEAPTSLAPKASYAYYIRRFSSTVQANAQERKELLGLANRVPFDDQINPKARLSALNLTLIQAYLQEIRSSLAETAADMPFMDLCRSLNIVDGPDEMLQPKNVGILLFCATPQEFFPYAKIDVVEFPDEDGTDFVERSFTGPLHDQVQSALRYLKNLVVQEKVHKVADRAEAERCFSYPFPAIEEALVNAVYHRSYEEREPVEVRVFPGRIEILSYPGPMPPLRKETIGKQACRRYRNSRIGDFFRELELTEGRNTGIRKINLALAANGSPPAEYDTDDERSYFSTVLKTHPLFLGETANEPVTARSEPINEPTNEPINGPAAQARFASLSELENQIVQALRREPSLTREQLASLTDVSRATVTRRLAKLRDEGFLQRVGPKKTGHWEVRGQE